MNKIGGERRGVMMRERSILGLLLGGTRFINGVV